jgi:1,4-alpha-glucan branching enzyme
MTASLASAKAGGRGGTLAIVLHTHMPYVEGFGTWPFGEEWLWEAMIGCYLPLLELLDAGAPLTLSLTPVLCDQLEAPGVGERFERYIDETRRTIKDEDVEGLRAGGHAGLARELLRAWEADYERALRRFAERGGDLLAALAPHAQWTSSATHAVLPLLASDEGVALQVRSGVAAHRLRFDDSARWRGGFWLPECAHAPWLEPLLATAGVRSTCIELTDRFGEGDARNLQPLRGDGGVTLVPIDRETISLVWSDRGYPAAGVYRDYHHNTLRNHKPWANDGSVYDPALAGERVRRHATDCVARTIVRLRATGSQPAAGGLVVCALDTELLGHWWYEGIAWLGAVVEECARQGLALARLDDALHDVDAVPAQRPESERGAGVSTWGKGRDLSTWSGPAVAEMAFAARAAELRLLAVGGEGAAPVRQLLALQASDWPFLVSRELAAPYARERFEGHRRAFERALDGGATLDAQALRNIAVHAEMRAMNGVGTGAQG